MKLSHLAALAALPVAIVSAQTATDTNEGSRLSLDPESGAWNFAWWGVNARTYFVLNSDLNLANWTYWPVIEQGVGAPISYGFWLSPRPDRLFLRLKYTDQPATDPYAADFDGDGIPSGWEIEHGLDPFNAADAANTSGGLTYFDIYTQSLGVGANPLQAPLGLNVYSP